MIFKVTITPNFDAPDNKQGYCKADTIENARLLIPNKDAKFFPMREGVLWQGAADESVFWVN